MTGIAIFVLRHTPSGLCLVQASTDPAADLARHRRQIELGTHPLPTVKLLGNQPEIWASEILETLDPREDVSAALQRVEHWQRRLGSTLHRNDDETLREARSAGREGQRRQTLRRGQRDYQDKTTKFMPGQRVSEDRATPHGEDDFRTPIFGFTRRDIANAQKAARFAKRFFQGMGAHRPSVRHEVEEPDSE